jgi:toxin-antitoxin system PIN domain toxin
MFCRATQQSFLRLLTNRSVLAPYGLQPLTNREAWQVCDDLLADTRVALRNDEPAGLEQRWRDFAVREMSSPKLWMDAYLAAYASVAGFRLVTADTGFKQFPGLDLLLLGAGT